MSTEIYTNGDLNKRLAALHTEIARLKNVVRELDAELRIKDGIIRKQVIMLADEGRRDEPR